MSPSLLVVAGMVGIAVAPGCSEEPVRPGLRGRVLRRDGTPVAGARVEVGGHAAVTDEAGAFGLPRLRAGGAFAAVSIAGEPGHIVPVAIPAGEDEVRVIVAPPPQEGAIDLWFGGDVMLARRFEDPDADGVPGDGLVVPEDARPGASAALAWIAPLLSRADLAIVNLETAVTDVGWIHPTKPVTFRSAPAVLEALAAAGVDVVGLGNDHVYDYLDPGLFRMLQLVDAAGLSRVGAGRDYEDALEPLFVERNGVRVAILAATTVSGRAVHLDSGEPTVARPPYFTADPPWLTGGMAKAGAMPLEREALEASIRRAQAGRADLIVLLAHGGVAYSQKESEHMRVLLREAVERGVDLVVGHHPHVIQPVEIHRGVPIFYSIGNLVFDQPFVETMGALVVEARGERGRGFTDVAVRPVWREAYVPRALVGPDGAQLLRRFASASAPHGARLRIDPGGAIARLEASPGEDEAAALAVEAELPGGVGAAGGRSAAGAAGAAVGGMGTLDGRSAAGAAVGGMGTLDGRSAAGAAGAAVRSMGIAGGRGASASAGDTATIVRSAPIHLAELRARGRFVVGVAGPANIGIDLGRDLLPDCGFDDGGVDDSASPIGWRVLGDEKDVTSGVLRLERTEASARDSTARTSGRIPIPENARLSLTGAWRGDDGAGTAVGRLVLYGSRTAEAEPLAVVEARERAPRDWRRFWVDIVPPAGARYAEVQLVHEPPTRGPAGAIELDDVSLVSWSGPVRPADVRPSDATYIALEGTPGRVSLTLLTAAFPEAGDAPGKP